MFIFLFSFILTVPLSQCHSQLPHSEALISVLTLTFSQNSLKLTPSNSHLSVSLPPAQLILNVTATEARHHRPTSRPTPPITSLSPIHFRSVVSLCVFFFKKIIFFCFIVWYRGTNCGTELNDCIALSWVELIFVSVKDLFWLCSFPCVFLGKQTG